MELTAMAERFCLSAPLREIRPYGNGNVNDTFLVTLVAAERYLLQRLNSQIFPDPALVMANLKVVALHMRRQTELEDAKGRWEVVEIVPCRNGSDFFIDDQGDCWRLVRFIEKTVTHDTVTSSGQARELGYGLGRFHRLLADLAPDSLHDTLPGFHVTPRYLAQYDATTAAGRQAAGNRYCREFIEARRQFASVLEEGRGKGLLKERVMHGDPKVNNFLVDDESGRVVSLVDLDTVKPGLVQYDLGDCLRSACNRAGEEEADPARVDFDLDCCQAILEGYLGEASAFLVDHDYDSLYDAVRLISFELGLRFYADHLAGNRYFKVRDGEHNLRRALVQFRLTERIEAREREIRAMVQSLR